MRKRLQTETARLQEEIRLRDKRIQEWGLLRRVMARAEARAQQLGRQMAQLQDARNSAADEVVRLQRVVEEWGCGGRVRRRQKNAQATQAAQVQELTARCQVETALWREA